MGIRLTAEQKKRQREIHAARVAANPARYRPVAGRAVGWVDGEPPTVTHQAKRIAARGTRLKLVDDARLTAARAAYLTQIPANPGPPLAGPLSAVLQFRWTDAKLREVGWWTLPPDADNAAKTLADILALRGWMVTDAHVARLTVEKVALTAGALYRPGVLIVLETMDSAPAVLEIYDRLHVRTRLEVKDAEAPGAP